MVVNFIYFVVLKVKKAAPLILTPVFTSLLILLHYFQRGLEIVTHHMILLSIVYI